MPRPARATSAEAVAAGVAARESPCVSMVSILNGRFPSQVGAVAGK